MAKVITDNQYYSSIANAIRDKNGETATYKPSEMAEAIKAISGSAGGYIVPTYADSYGHGITFKDSSGNDIILSNTDFDFFMRYYDISTRDTHMLLGTNIVNSFYKNISFEIQKSGLAVWNGVSNNGSSWNEVTDGTTLSTQATFPAWYNLHVVLKNNVITFSLFKEDDGTPVELYSKSYTLTSGITINRSAINFGGNACTTNGIQMHFDAGNSYIYNDGVRVF